ncbi:hypothetical protein ARTHRO9AX_200055 [Arthrobacter sp. 9AX]|nr:hypothetical protein ARTHRO9AX_200055 [Arthrobacter sp. 9AX]
MCVRPNSPKGPPTACGRPLLCAFWLVSCRWSAAGGIGTQRCGPRIRDWQWPWRFRRRERAGRLRAGMAGLGGIRLVRAGFRRERFGLVHWRDGHMLPLSRWAVVP